MRDRDLEGFGPVGTNGPTLVERLEALAARAESAEQRATAAEARSARLAEALNKALEHVSAVGWPCDDAGRYDRNGTWMFMDALPREVDAAEIMAAHTILTDAAMKEGV